MTRLTQTVQKGGCAAKVAAAELRHILSKVRLPKKSDKVLIGNESFDDAGVYKVSPEIAMVQTLDFFTPIVDTPSIFGKIAAANALSDVYAMGGLPQTALAIFAFPLASMETTVATEVIQGACDIIEKSKASLVGGHTIDDETLKFGLSVTGFVHPDGIWSNAGAKPGDKLILTKPLGTGTLTAALKRQEATEKDIEDGIESMCQLNEVSSLLTEEEQRSIHAATDITGFGLAGHAYNIAKASEVLLEIEVADLPKFERAQEFLSKGFLTKAHRSNRQYVESHTDFQNPDPILQNLVLDPQTSGGLLLSVDAAHEKTILSKLQKNFPFTRKIGSVQSRDEHWIRFQ